MDYLPKYRSRSAQCLCFAALLALGSVSAFADSINNGGGNIVNSDNELWYSGAPGPQYGGYFLPSGTGYTSLADDPAFANLGLTPGTFLFTPNTMFAFTGTPIISILSANVDPLGGSIPLNDPGTYVSTFQLNGGGSVSAAAPEPGSLLMALSALFCAGLVYRYRTRAS